MPGTLEEFDTDRYGWIAEIHVVAILVVARKAGDGPGLARMLRRLEKLGAISWN